MTPAGEPSLSPPAAANPDAPLAGAAAANPIRVRITPDGPAPAARRRPGSAALDHVLAALVLGLAFLLASFPARNSDLWMHLAAGRALAEGHSPLGTDPFAARPEATPWVNPSWLYDLALYGLYQTVGGAGLVLAKALLVALLAAVLVRLGRAGRGGWLAAAGAALAVLATAPRLLLQPACVSYLFLALTLWLLERPHRRAAEAGARAVSPWAYWPIPLLFALWVNLDGWYLLGPVAVALYALGRLLDGRGGAERGEGSAESVRQAPPLRAPLSPLPSPHLLALAACLLACLVNPYGVRAFALPPDLGLTAPAGAAPAGLQRALPLSPFQPAYFRSGPGLTPAGLAYFPLLLLSAASFAVNRAGWRWSRALLWLAFFGLSAFQARAVPFFAVVAGPVMALNFQDYLRGRRGARDEEEVPPRWEADARLATALALVVLMVAAWPGWLQAGPFGTRRWAVEPNPSLERAGQQLARWHRAGVLGPRALGVCFAPEASHPLAWFCPAEKTFFDPRPSAPAGAVADYLAVWRGLTSTPRGQEGPDAPWRAVLRKHHVNHVVLYDRDPERLAPALGRLCAAPGEWPLICRAGGVAVFGWNDPEAGRRPAERFRELARALERRAFHPPAAEQAPSDGPALRSRPRFWWEALWEPAPAPASADREEAALCLQAFDAHLPRRIAVWQSALAAGLVGRVAGLDGLGPAAGLGVQLQVALPGKPSGPFAGLADFSLRAYLAREGYGPAGLLLTAVRAARRAVRADPGDAAAYQLLGEAYLRLAWRTREAVWGADLPLLRRLRQVQAAAALEQAVLFRPDLLRARQSLADLYLRMEYTDPDSRRRRGYQDVALKHLHELLKYTRAAGREPGEGRGQFAERLDRLRKVVDAQADRVRKLQSRYDVNARNLKSLDRARLALSLGLGGKALEVLLATEIADFGKPGVELELQLLLDTGRAREVGEGMDPDQEQAVGQVAYHWLRAQWVAAAGNYAEADRHLAGMVMSTLRPQGLSDQRITFRDAVALNAGMTVLDGCAPLGQFGQVLSQAYHQRWLWVRCRELVPALITEADVTALRGLLALEAGRAGKAGKDFRRAEVIARSGLPFPGRPLAARGLEWLAR